MMGCWSGIVCCLALSARGLRVNRALRTTHSRRETNRIIAAGRLSVNGVVAVGPDARLRVGDVVTFDGLVVAWSDDALQKHRYVKFHKPAGVVCTTDRRVPGNVHDAFLSVGGNDDFQSRRVYPIGRLDKESTGLLLLTSDGSIVNPLLRSSIHKKTTTTKEYHVVTSPVATDAHLATLAAGIIITTPARRHGQTVEVTARTAPCVVERSSATSTLRFVLGEGRNRQIRRMCAALGLTVTTLHRVGFAGVTLEGGCERPGDWAYLTAAEERAVGARTREERRTPEEKARRKAKKLSKRPGSL